MCVNIYIYNKIPETVLGATSHGQSHLSQFLKTNLTFNGFHHQQTLIT